MPIDNPISPFQIQSAGWRDLRQVMQVERACFQEDTWPLLDILFVLTFPGVIRLKVTLGEQIVAFASAEKRDGVGWITTIGVIPPYRRRGIARTLLAACERELSTARIRLCVRRSNEGAQRLYFQEGYHQIDTWQRYYRGGEDALVLEKDVDFH